MTDFGKIEPQFSNADFSAAAPEPMPEPDVAEAQFAHPEVAPLYSRINKKRAVMLLLFVGVIIAAIVMLGDGLLQNKLSEVEKIAKINPPEPPKFIDDNEEQNKHLKENSEAKNANVNVFDFDINKCLQQYSDEQCMDMFDKNLLITEKK